MADPEKAVPSPAIVDEIRSQRLPLPVVTIDGEIRVRGYVDYRSIEEAIEAFRPQG